MVPLQGISYAKSWLPPAISVLSEPDLSTLICSLSSAYMKASGLVQVLQ